MCVTSTSAFFTVHWMLHRNWRQSFHISQHNLPWRSKSPNQPFFNLANTISTKTKATFCWLWGFLVYVCSLTHRKWLKNHCESEMECKLQILTAWQIIWNILNVDVIWAKRVAFGCIGIAYCTIKLHFPVSSLKSMESNSALLNLILLLHRLFLYGWYMKLTGWKWIVVIRFHGAVFADEMLRKAKLFWRFNSNVKYLRLLMFLRNFNKSPLLLLSQFAIRLDSFWFSEDLVPSFAFRSASSNNTTFYWCASYWSLTYKL